MVIRGKFSVALDNLCPEASLRLVIRNLIVGVAKGAFVIEFSPSNNTKPLLEPYSPKGGG